VSEQVYLLIILVLAFSCFYFALKPPILRHSEKPPTDPPVLNQEAVDPFLENHLRNILLKIKFGEGPHSVKGVTFEPNFSVIASLSIDQIERFSDLLLKYKGDIDLLLRDKKEKARITSDTPIE
jgi:hypothetical protein